MPPRPKPQQPVAAKPQPRPAGPVVVELASHASHTCARRDSGDVLCWGRNAYGQLGSGNRDATPRTVKVAGVQDAKQIVTGSDFSCALRATGQVVCWGNNEDGQLGDGRGAKISARSLRPVAVSQVRGASQISAGDWHACALDRQGAVWCWGNGENGQIGSDATRAFSVPRKIEQLGPVRQIASGAKHVCALQRDGRVKCWGRNTEGQLGDGQSGSRIKPVFVSGISGATGLWSGHNFSCAALQDQSVRCWGSNASGILGAQARGTSKSGVPVVLSGVQHVAEIVGGEAHACARVAGGRVMCWGSNDNGRALGQGQGSVAKPTPVRGIADATTLTAGAEHTCVASSAGGLRCWGANTDGQLGRNRVAGVDPIRDRGLFSVASRRPRVERS